MDQEVKELITYGLTTEEGEIVCKEYKICKEEEFWRMMVERTFPQLGFPKEGKGYKNWKNVYLDLVSFTQTKLYISFTGSLTDYFTILRRNSLLITDPDFFFFVPKRPIAKGNKLFFPIHSYKDNFTLPEAEDFFNSLVQKRTKVFTNRSPQDRDNFVKVYGKDPNLIQDY